MKRQERKKLNLGDAIIGWRTKRGLGQRGAAKAMRVSAATVCRIETGEMVPDGENLMKIFNWLMTPTRDEK
jgi:transcriptional regulator with XRE-family HTH domain